MASKQSNTKSMLQTAEALIHGQRQKDYGNKLQNFSQIAMIWNGILAKKLKVYLTPEDVASLMIGLKLARLASSPLHEDSWVDIAGYVGCVDVLQKERNSGEPLEGVTIDLQTAKV